MPCSKYMILSRLAALYFVEISRTDFYREGGKYTGVTGGDKFCLA